MVADPIGPRRLTKVRQVSIPVRLLREVGLEAGSEVYFAIAPDDSAAIRILPARLIKVRRK